MMDELFFLTPLLILPGVGLLLVSTSTRYANLHDEIHHWVSGSHDLMVIENAHLLKRARFFRNALVSLYLCVLTFTLASLLGAILDFMNGSAEIVVFIFAFMGIVCLGFASIELVRESLLSMQVIEAHINDLMDEAE